VIYYKTALARVEVENKPKAMAGGAGVKTLITVTSNNNPVRGALVVAFTDFANRAGDQDHTNAKGQVRLNLGGVKKLEQLYVYGPNGFWGKFGKNVKVGTGVKVEIAAIDLRFVDGVRHFVANAPLDAGQGVTVGVVDTGVGPHRDLNVAGGMNAVLDGDPLDFKDNGDQHGTHVAGIIASRGTPETGVRGIAPGVTLRSYRVFAKGERASSFAIAKAIDAATADDCDLINLSLGGDSDDTINDAVKRARAGGALVIAATGNDGRQPVAFPGAFPLALAVTALGVKKTFPKGSVEEADVVKPFGAVDPNDYIAAFSNVGSEVDLTGPGVGIISTVPNDEFAVMSGTSMATPAVTGLAAVLLAVEKTALAMLPRDQTRSDAMAKVVLQAAKKRGFPASLEGNGLPKALATARMV
jgi:subtilisin